MCDGFCITVSIPGVHIILRLTNYTFFLLLTILNVLYLTTFLMMGTGEIGLNLGHRGDSSTCAPPGNTARC